MSISPGNPKRLFVLLDFAKKLRIHLNRSEPASFGGGMAFSLRRSELHKDLLVLVGLGFDTDTVLSRLSQGTKYPERVISILTRDVPTFPLPKDSV